MEQQIIFYFKKSGISSTIGSAAITLIAVEGVLLNSLSKSD